MKTKLKLQKDESKLKAARPRRKPEGHYSKEYLEYICEIYEDLFSIGWQNIPCDQVEHEHWLRQTAKREGETRKVVISQADRDHSLKNIQGITGRRIRTLFDERNPELRAIPLSPEFFQIYRKCLITPYDSESYWDDALEWAKNNDAVQFFQKSESEKVEDDNMTVFKVIKRWISGNMLAYGLRIISRDTEEKDPFARVYNNKAIRTSLNSYEGIKQRMGEEKVLKFSQSDISDLKPEEKILPPKKTRLKLAASAPSEGAISDSLTDYQSSKK